MRNTSLIRMVALVLFGISLLIALWLIGQRAFFEHRHRAVELVVGYDEVQKLSRMGGVSDERLLQQLRQSAGVTSIALGEDTVESLVKSGKATMIKGSDLVNLLRIGQLNPFVVNNITKRMPIREASLYLVVDESLVYDRMREVLRLELGANNVTELGYGILEVRDDEEALLQTGLGLPMEIAHDIESFGFEVIPRFRNGNRVRPQVIRKKLDALSGLRMPTTVIFEGDSVLGYPTQLALVAQKLKDARYDFGYLEFFEQLGERNLARRMPQFVRRVHSIHENDLDTLPMSRAVDRYVRSVRERNVRVLYVRPYLNQYSNENIVAYNLRFVGRIGTALQAEGFQLKSETIGIRYPSVRTWQSAGMTLGMAVAVLVFASLFVAVSIRVALITLTTMVGLSLLSGVVGSGGYWQQLMALVATLIFPPLALITQFPHRDNAEKKSVTQTIGYITRVVGICLLGALLVVGFLTDPMYAFGIRPFFGVKVAFLVPLLIVGLYYYLTPHRLQSAYFVFRRILYSPVRASVLVVMGLCVVILAVYMVRSGNDIKGEVSTLEVMMRDGLERLLVVRPRTKEFLIGYPFLVLAYLYVDHLISRKWLWFFNGLGVIALISLLNAFSHLHTPLRVTVLRCGIGVVLGVGVGFLYAFAWRWIRSMYLRWTR